jgi:hypothetical protein
MSVSPREITNASCLPAGGPQASTTTMTAWEIWKDALESADTVCGGTVEDVAPMAIVSPAPEPALPQNPQRELRLLRIQLGTIIKQFYGSGDATEDAAQCLQIFRANLFQIERRIRREGIDEAQTAGTYRQLLRLLNGCRGKDTAFAVRLSQEILQHSAQPHSIQFCGETQFNLSAVEMRLYREYPSVVAGLLTDLILTGQYLGAFGDKLRIRQADLEHIKTKVTYSCASHLLQQIAESIYLRRAAGSPVTGKDPYDSAWAMQDVANRIAGTTVWKFVLSHKYVQYKKAGCQIFDSQEQLKCLLTEAQNTGKLPMILELPSPTVNEMGKSTLQWQAVAIRKFETESGRIYLEDQWQNPTCSTTTLRDLYTRLLATRMTPSQTLRP